MQFEQLEASNTRQHRGWVGGAGSRPARDSQSRLDSSVNGAVVKCRALPACARNVLALLCRLTDPLRQYFVAPFNDLGETL
jgi:hypothetical protein